MEELEEILDRIHFYKNMHFSNSHIFQINLLISIKFFKLNKKKINIVK